MYDNDLETYNRAGNKNKKNNAKRKIDDCFGKLTQFVITTDIIWTGTAWDTKIYAKREKLVRTCPYVTCDRHAAANGDQSIRVYNGHIFRMI